MQTVQTSVPASDKPASTSTAEAGGDQLSRLSFDGQKVMYYDSNDSNDSNDSKWWWVCSRLEVTAFTRDARKRCAMVTFPVAQAEKIATITTLLDRLHINPLIYLGILDCLYSEYRRALLSMGLQIAGTNKGRNLLTQYIQTSDVDQRARCMDRCGWIGNVFVLPAAP